MKLFQQYMARECRELRQRLVVDEDDNSEFRLDRVKTTIGIDIYFIV